MLGFDPTHPRAQTLKLLAALCVALWALGFNGHTLAQSTADATPVLTRASQVLNLTADQAARSLAVRLRGVVVGEAPPVGKSFVLWDESEYIYVRSEMPGNCEFQRGDLIEVEGYSGEGGFSPSVHMTSGQKLGAGTLPEPRALTFEQLNAGQFDAQWVRVRGIVRRCEPSATWTGRWQLTVAIGSQFLTVHVNGELDLMRLVDADVSVNGLLFNQHNMSRQFVRALLFVPKDVPLVIETAAPENPFSTPIRPVRSLLQFERQERYGHRVHVRGQVLHQAPDGWLWIRDGDRGLRVAVHQSEKLSTGDIVDVLGFATQGNYTPWLEDALFLKTGSETAPLPATPADLRAAIAHDSDLVAVEGQLVDLRRTPNNVTLTLDWQGRLIAAMLLVRDGETLPANWIVGSVLRATGMVSVAEPRPTNGVWEPNSFELQLRSPADVRVLRPAPWWTLTRILWAVAVLVVALGSAAAAVMLAARRRLRDQEIQRAKAEAEFSAILTERNRLAREIHDTLAQDLAAVSMQLELAKATGDKDRIALVRHLETAHQLVRNGLAEARASIWNMRSQVLEKSDLVDAIQGVLRQLTDDTSVTVNFNFSGDRGRFPPVMENALLRIAHEAIANAMNHAAPKHVNVDLMFTDKVAVLAVTDDGAGFDPAQATRRAGHFGLAGMRERAAELGAKFTLVSSPGRGTNLTVRVPTKT